MLTNVFVEKLRFLGLTWNWESFNRQRVEIITLLTGLGTDGEAVFWLWHVDWTKRSHQKLDYGNDGWNEMEEMEKPERWLWRESTNEENITSVLSLCDPDQVPYFLCSSVFLSVQQRVIGLLSEFSKLAFVVRFVIAQSEHLRCWVNIACWDCSRSGMEKVTKMSCSLSQG